MEWAGLAVALLATLATAAAYQIGHLNGYMRGRKDERSKE